VHWVLSDGWTFASGDYAFLLEVAGVHDTPEFVVAFLFVGGVVWELAVAVLTLMAFVPHSQGSASETDFYRAFTTAL